MRYRKRRLVAVLFLLVSFLTGVGFEAYQNKATDIPANEETSVLGVNGQSADGTVAPRAVDVLGQLDVKGRAPKTGYKRAQFGDGWADAGMCDVRNFILKRDLREVKTRSDTDCTVISGVLEDPYSNKRIDFARGPSTSDDVQIDHVVALSDAWQKGAQQLSANDRQKLANDPLNLLAVDGKTNSDKGDGDAATWLPPNKSYRCKYVARQIAVKYKYKLYVTEAEKTAMKNVLSGCEDQRLPIVSSVSWKFVQVNFF